MNNLIDIAGGVVFASIVALAASEDLLNALVNFMVGLL